jgi:hypothetical protein
MRALTSNSKQQTVELNMSKSTDAILRSAVDSLTEIMDRMEDRGDFYDEDGHPFADALALKIERDNLAGLADSAGPQARVLVYVFGGVADYFSEGVVAVEVFDNDNYEDDPVATSLPSAEFEGLAMKCSGLAAYYATERGEA